MCIRFEGDFIHIDKTLILISLKYARTIHVLKKYFVLPLEANADTAYNVKGYMTL